MPEQVDTWALGDAGSPSPGVTRMEGLEALQKPLPWVNGSQSSCASKPVTGGDVTALDGLGGVPATAM